MLAQRTPHRMNSTTPTPANSMVRHSSKTVGNNSPLSRILKNSGTTERMQMQVAAMLQAA